MSQGANPQGVTYAFASRPLGNAFHEAKTSPRLIRERRH